MKRERDSEERRCVDCGKKTTDYRCPECWEKVREEAEAYDLGQFVNLSLSQSDLRRSGINI